VEILHLLVLEMSRESSGAEDMPLLFTSIANFSRRAKATMSQGNLPTALILRGFPCARFCVQYAHGLFSGR
jgi:hypothetical protein